MKQDFDINRINVDGIEVAYTLIGSGKKVAVVCQGWATSFDLYTSIAEILQDEYTVLLFDFPGFGRTVEPEEPWDVKRYCNFLEKLCFSLNICKTTLIGHSFGGRVIIEEASQISPFLTIENIILIDAAGVMPRRSSVQKFKTKLYKAKRAFLTSKLVHPLFPEVVDDWVSRQGSDDYRAASTIMKKVLVGSVNYDQTELLEKIKAPTLLVWGEVDDATPLWMGRVMEEKIADSGLVVLEGCGHYSFLENAPKFKSVLSSFLLSGGEQQ